MDLNRIIFLEALNYTANGQDGTEAPKPPHEALEQHNKIFNRKGRRNAIFLPNLIRETIAIDAEN